MRSPMRVQAALWLGLIVLMAALPVQAQAPLPPEAADIASCLCLQRAVNALGADMSGQQGAYQAAQDELARIDAQLQSARAGIDVNNPAAVAQFRQLLERREAAFKRSTGLATGDLLAVTERYNTSANQYHARCTNLPRDPRLLESVQATLACPPVY